MGSMFVATGCLLLGVHHIYDDIQDNPKYSKSEKRFRIGVGVIMSVLGIILLARNLFVC